jgi:transcription-repair coupling factor (superfamily II helicase)
VSQRDDQLIREAVLREMERAGQVFFVHNRVQSIEVEAERLRRLIPEARIVVGHGQLPEDQLERVMVDFAAGRSDVLVCTTIIESGLDMPNVNTIIINRADKFGLAQLYQLRGRVGRGAFRAYAYLLYDSNSRLRLAAVKRLRAIFEASELGAGFRIAMRDLEIRGAGNLLGVEQSGHVAAVGFELYSRLLADAVEALKVREGRAEPKPQKLPVPTVDLPISGRLPESYIPAMGARLALYNRMGTIETMEEVLEIADELLDRFGEPPRLVKNLIYLLQVRVLATRGAVESVVAEDGQVVARMRAGALVSNRSALERLNMASLHIGRTQVRLRNSKGWQDALKRVLEEIVGN